MPRIIALSVCHARVPLDDVTSFATRTVKAREFCLVKVHSAEGGEGIGFCYAGNYAGDLSSRAVEELFAPLLLGQESTRVEGLWDEMYRESLLHGRTGSVMRALSAVDVALWDLNSRSARLPLYSYLGCTASDRVPAYASGGYYLEGKTPRKLGEELAAYVRSGFKAVKMKVGRLRLEEEEDRMRAAREAVGPDAVIMLDANNAWQDLPTAMSFCRRYAKYDPYWMEEPFSPDDIENHARLSAAGMITVATGEIEAGRWRFKELLDKHAAMVLQPDALVCGGITEFRRIAQTAASYGVTLSPHWFHDLHAHLVAAFPNARYVEFFPDDRVFNFRNLINHQLQTKDGDLLLPTAAGLGFEFDEKAVARFAVGAGGPWTTVRQKGTAVG